MSVCLSVRPSEPVPRLDLLLSFAELCTTLLVLLEDNDDAIRSIVFCDEGGDLRTFGRQYIVVAPRR